MSHFFALPIYRIEVLSLIEACANRATALKWLERNYQLTEGQAAMVFIYNGVWFPPARRLEMPVEFPDARTRYLQDLSVSD